MFNQAPRLTWQCHSLHPYLPYHESILVPVTRVTRDREAIWLRWSFEPRAADGWLLRLRRVLPAYLHELRTRPTATDCYREPSPRSAGDFAALATPISRQCEHFSLCRGAAASCWCFWAYYGIPVYTVQVSKYFILMFIMFCSVPQYSSSLITGQGTRGIRWGNRYAKDHLQ